MNWTLVSIPINAMTLICFVILASRRRPGLAAITVGAFHLLLSAVFSVAPFRSFFDAHYPGFRIGLLHFEGRSAVLPATLLFAWAFSSALLCVSRAEGRWFWFVAAGDAAFALNLLAATLSLPGDNEIQFGQYLTIRGLLAVALMIVLFSGGPIASSLWAFRRTRRPA
jgi:hypothetical protein